MKNTYFYLHRLVKITIVYDTYVVVFSSFFYNITRVILTVGRTNTAIRC